MRCAEPKLHRFMISECEYSSCPCMLSKSESLSSLRQSSSLQQKNNKKKENNQCPRVKVCFKINGLFHFGIFRFWGALIFHVTYFSCLSTSNMSQILLLPTGDLVCVPLVSFGFSFLVVIVIGSLARFMCFSNVDLSWIF